MDSTPRSGSLDRALTAARRAVDIAPSNHLAYQALAVAHFFRKETAACRNACERALALNPLDGSNEAIFLITFMGEWDRGTTLIRRAMELNPHHPGWYRLILAMDAYHRRDYRAAVTETVKANVPGVFWTNVVLAGAYGQLGDMDDARQAVRDLLAQQADFAASAEETIDKWFDRDRAAHTIDGLRKAGLFARDQRPADSDAARAAAGFWIVVRPFKFTGSHPDVAALAEGLSEEIVTGLSRFSYLKVVAGGAAQEAVPRYARREPAAGRISAAPHGTTGGRHDGCAPLGRDLQQGAQSASSVRGAGRPRSACGVRPLRTRTASSRIR